jgi:hypothetical protein
MNTATALTPIRGRSLRIARNRRGSALLEAQMAFALLGIGLAGLCPLVVMQIRQVAALESRLQGQVYPYNSTNMMQQVQYDTSSRKFTMLAQPQAVNYYLVPWKNPWTQKLAGAAQVVAVGQNAGSLASPAIPGDRGPLTGGSGNATVTVVELDAPAGGQTATAYVQVAQ